MSPRFRRRDFLRVTIVSAAATAAGPLGCSSDGDEEGEAPQTEEDVLRVFPQGMASGDPRPGSVILWTRVEPEGEAEPAVAYEVALDEGFENVVVSGEVVAEAASDHTVRLKIVDLEPYTTYYYRFRALGVRSDVGRTKTAPEPDQDVPVRLAFSSCQDYVGRYYHTWRALVEEEEKGDKPIDFVVCLGDYIYETDGDPDFQTRGEGRDILIPDGIDLGDAIAARTLRDYRAIYRQYRSDPDLRRAHQLYPFVIVWDDHEFANDCWQDHSTHFSGAEGLEKVTQQREDATRAWFEYQVADVEHDEEAGFPDDIRIYRRLRFGRHVELFMTDQRYYRDAHVIPPGPADPEVGKLTQNSAIGSRIFLVKPVFDEREAAAAPTMLGAEQKAWLVEGLRSSSATWKLCGSQAQMAQMAADLSDVPGLSLPEQFMNRIYLTVDQWDGYRSERAELLGEIASVDNVVVLSGDIHAFYASELHEDFDAPGERPAALEFVTAGASSQAIAPGARMVIEGDPLLSGLGLLPLLDRFDELLVQASPHYQYARSDSNGIGVVDVTEDEMIVSYLMVGDVRSREYTGVRERVRMRVGAGTRRIELL